MNSKLGPITAIVNNASTPERRSGRVTADRLHRIVRRDYRLFLCSREAVKPMSTRHGGAGRCIVNISSAVPRRAHEFLDSPYKASFERSRLGSRERSPMRSGDAVTPGLSYGIITRFGEPARVDRVRRRRPLQRGDNPAEGGGFCMNVNLRTLTHTQYFAGFGWRFIRKFGMSQARTLLYTARHLPSYIQLLLYNCCFLLPPLLFRSSPPHSG